MAPFASPTEHDMTNLTKKIEATCWKCGGAGRILTFSHVENGVCFTCYGTGKLSITPDTLPSRDRAILELAAHHGVELSVAEAAEIALLSHNYEICAIAGGWQIWGGPMGDKPIAKVRDIRRAPEAVEAHKVRRAARFRAHVQARNAALFA